MNIIKPNVEIIHEPNLLKRIEIAGRTAYKSEDKICTGSAKKFFDFLVKHGHESVLEHSNIIVYTQTDTTCKHILAILQDYERETQLPHFIRNSNHEEDVNIDGDIFEYSNIFSGNLRAWRSLVKQFYAEPIFIHLFYNHFAFADIYENASLTDKEKGIHPLSTYDLAESMYDETAQAEIIPWAPGEIHNIITARFTCSRGISHEIVRHRLLSPTQESTRYVRYNDNTIIEPWWWNDTSNDNIELWRTLCLSSGLHSESTYKSFIDSKMAPQGARGCLNTDTKTEVVLTGCVQYWRHFLMLREDMAAHPDVRILAKMFRENSEIDTKDWWGQNV